MMQQARLLTEYAAFRAVRAGSIDQVTCKKMLEAAIEGILPGIGRTDTAKNLLETYTIPNTHTLTTPMLNQSGIPGLDIVDINYLIQQPDGAQLAPYTATDFDDPNHPLSLVAQLTYNYELRIPFADFMIHEMWTGGNYLNGTVDQLVPAANSSTNLSDVQMKASRMTKYASDPASSSTKAKMYAAASTMHRYFVPIVSAYSMRMMSNLPANLNVGSQQQCTGIP
jgi:hypothetical protein